MFRNLLNPLRSHLGEHGPDEDLEIVSPEDLSNDVVVELTRTAIDNLKHAANAQVRSKILPEIHRALLQHTSAKDVFREMDGFLVLMNVLSTIFEYNTRYTSKDEILQETIECLRFVFLILDETLSESRVNLEYFENNIGYESLELSLESLVTNPETVDQTLGFLLSFALHDFTWATFFTRLRGEPEGATDSVLTEVHGHLASISQPRAIRLLWIFGPRLDSRYSVLKLFEYLSSKNHRNLAILSSLRLADPLFSYYLESRQQSCASVKERQVLHKLLSRLLEMGITNAEARLLFQKAVNADDDLDVEVLEFIRCGMRSRWISHISMESEAALIMEQKQSKGLPSSGISFLMWINVADFPKRIHQLFQVASASNALFRLSLRNDGTLELWSFGQRQTYVFSKSSMRKARWTHLALVHYPHRTSDSNIRLFIDGVMVDSVNGPYPKAFPTVHGLTYTVGDDSKTASMSWCLASAHLLSSPLCYEKVRMIYHLGPRYSGNYQDPALVRFLTYESSTSLNIFLTSLSTKQSSSSTLPVMRSVVKNGLGLSDKGILLLFASSSPKSGHNATIPLRGHEGTVKTRGDVFVVKVTSLDMALWKVGGAAVVLRFIQLANSQHELSRAIGILADGLRNSWQNSEDMERMRGYDILADILRSKAHLLNLTGFETLFEFLGLDFRSPENSTIINTVGYRAISLDFELWSKTHLDIQRAHLEHFSTLMERSRHKSFNVKQRLPKLNLVKRLLVALQTDWYQPEAFPFILQALHIACRSRFTKDDAIKPLVSYLAANLHEDNVDGLTSSGSLSSVVDDLNSKDKATQVLQLFISLLSLPKFYAVFNASLPCSRICLLLLGERPTSDVTAEIMNLVGQSVSFLASFILKFDSVNGWSILRRVLPYCWGEQAVDKACNIILSRLTSADDSGTSRDWILSFRSGKATKDKKTAETLDKISEWRISVQRSQRSRLRKSVQDLREHRRQVKDLQAWARPLTAERGLWPHKERKLWRLDETEGPHRIRIKMEPDMENGPSSRVDGNIGAVRGLQDPESGVQSILQPGDPGWSDSYNTSPCSESPQLADDAVEDKLRRIRHNLEFGDIIEAVATVARISGVDSSLGLLIIGRSHIYMVDGVVENDAGEVVDARDVPKRMLFIPGSVVELSGRQKIQVWAREQIATCNVKRFLFRDVALEINFKDNRSLLVVFLDKTRRLEVDRRIHDIVNRFPREDAASNFLSAPLLSRFGSRMLSPIREDQLSLATRRWQHREISNFAYLSILNQISGRTPNDATQYPVFPWVIKDYTSETLDLFSPESYRDLLKPMGALTPSRREAAELRYASLESVQEEPFHYGTHFSSSMIVCHFLIRMAPFTNMFKTLQGGAWDLPDRLFSDITRTYQSAAVDISGDVRELIPEFYTCPEFLENTSNHDFGVQSSTGRRIHDVILPPWARNDPLLFIVVNRKALESAYVSEHLSHWIDLIWGYKQRDLTSLNVFQPLSYAGTIEIDSIKDEVQREATVGIIHNFGQTPRKLFSTPHPERLKSGSNSLPVGATYGIEEDPHLLTQGERCIRDLGFTVPVRTLVLNIADKSVVPCPEDQLCFPLQAQIHLQWNTDQAELRLSSEHKTIQIIENVCCTCAAFADASTLVTGSSDYTVRLWRVLRGHGRSSSIIPTGIKLSHIMRIHSDEVVCVTATSVWSLVVSGSKDGSAALWDLNRGTYIRSIWHVDGGVATTVHLVEVNESTGYIATCSRVKLCLHTINARPIATLDLTAIPSFSPLVPTITSMAFHEREYSNLGILATGSADGSITLRTWTADGTAPGEKAQWEFVTIRSMKIRPMKGNGSRRSGVTALRFVGESMYHGEENGKTFKWRLPE